MSNSFPIKTPPGQIYTSSFTHTDIESHAEMHHEFEKIFLHVAVQKSQKQTEYIMNE